MREGKFLRVRREKEADQKTDTRHMPPVSVFAYPRAEKGIEISPARVI